ncbi:MAG: hypothetical protein QOF45_311 [Gaiellaceae bacterium]|nr:hypothetical protein [Gaiellaceae bacterium]
MRPVRVAGDAEDAHARVLEIEPPVTQEHQLLRSGGRPVEEVEEEQDGAVLEQFFELGSCAVVEPEHASNLLREPEHSVRVAASRCIRQLAGGELDDERDLADAVLPA